MRPKRKILLIDADESRASVWRFTLETHGFAVTAAADASRALSAARAIDFRLILLAWPGLKGSEKLLDALRRRSVAPRLLLANGVQSRPDTHAEDAVWGACSPVVVLERVRVMSARKRGPRKTVNREPCTGGREPITGVEAA